MKALICFLQRRHPLNSSILIAGMWSWSFSFVPLENNNTKEKTILFDLKTKKSAWTSSGRLNLTGRLTSK